MVRREDSPRINENMFFLQSKKRYEKAFGDSERAQEAYKKADADINLSRAEVEKVNIILGSSVVLISSQLINFVGLSEIWLLLELV